MTTTFPPKPWEEGATFTNDTTGVGYTYSGGKWLASGGPKDEGIYMPLAGDSTKTGKINLVTSSGAQLTVNRGSSVNSAITTAQVMADGTFETIKTSFNDTHLVTKKYTDQAIKDAVADAPSAPSPFRKYKYAGDRAWETMRPGEFQMWDKNKQITNELDKCQAIFFTGVDADGNRAVRDENRVSYSSWGGSALNIVNSSQTRLYFRAPIGMLEYGADIDCYSLWWQELDAGATRTSTFTKFTNSQTVHLQCADLFF